MPVEAGEDLKTLTQSELATAYRHWRDVTPLEMREFYDAIQAAPADTFIHLQGSVQARDVDDDATDDGEDDAVEQYYIAMLERRAKRVQELKENVPLPVKKPSGNALRELGGRILQRNQSAFNRPQTTISDLHETVLQPKLHHTQTTYISNRNEGASYSTPMMEEAPLRKPNRSHSISIDDTLARQAPAFPIHSTSQTQGRQEMWNSFPGSNNMPTSTAFITTAPQCDYGMVEMVDLTEEGPFYPSVQQPHATNNDDRMAHVSDWMHSLPTSMEDCEPMSLVPTSAPVCLFDQEMICSPDVRLEPIPIIPPPQPFSLPPFPQSSHHPNNVTTALCDRPSHTQSTFQSTSFQPQPQLFQPFHFETATPPMQYEFFGPPLFTLQQPPIAHVQSQFEPAVVSSTWLSFDQNGSMPPVESHNLYIPVQAQQPSTVVSAIPVSLPPVPSCSAPLELGPSWRSVPASAPSNAIAFHASETPLEATTSQSPWWESFTLPSKEACAREMERSVQCPETAPDRGGSLKRKRSHSPTIHSSPSTPVKAALATVSFGAVDANTQRLYVAGRLGGMDEVERNLLYRVGYERRCERLGERLAQRETATRPRKKPKKAKRADATGAALVVRQKKDCDRKQHPTSKAVRPKNVRNTCKPSPSRFLTRSRGDGVSFSSC